MRATLDIALTFSVVALDSASGTTGAAVASCVPLETLRRVYGAVPERGALITQSYLHDTAHGVGLALLEKGTGAQDVVLALTDPGFDPEFSLRQYAVIDARGDTASFTGTGANAYAGQRSGATDRYVFLAQGNWISGSDVLERASVGFASPEACDLADALVRGLLAAGAPGGGDARCVPYGLPAQSALLIVGRPEAPLLELAVDGSDPPSADPLISLRQSYEAWRAEHPCPEPPSSTTSAEGCSVAGPAASAHWLLLVLAALVLRISTASTRGTPAKGPGSLR